MPDDRKYQPSLIWSHFRTWAERRAGEEDWRMQPQRLSLYIYHASEPGAWLIQRGRLYWDSDLDDGHFTNTDAGDLEENADVLGEIVATGLGPSHEGPLMIAPDLESFLAEIGLKN